MITWTETERDAIELNIITGLCYGYTTYQQAADSAGVSYTWARKFINKVRETCHWKKNRYNVQTKYDGRTVLTKLTRVGYASPSMHSNI